MAEITVRQVVPADLEMIHDLLSASALPYGGVENALANMLVAEQANTTIGVVGLEHFGEIALLRSLIRLYNRVDVLSVGRTLCNALMKQGREQGVATLYALTTMAERFLAQQGFTEIERDEAPSAIKSTAEFRHLCPENARLLRLQIEADRCLR